jgi:hypothetical protein
MSLPLNYKVTYDFLTNNWTKNHITDIMLSQSFKGMEK